MTKIRHVYIYLPLPFENFEGAYIKINTSSKKRVKIYTCAKKKIRKLICLNN